MRQLLLQSSLIVKFPLQENELVTPFETSQEEEFFSLSITSRLTIEEEKRWFSFCKKLNPGVFDEGFSEFDEKKNKMYNLVTINFLFLFFLLFPFLFDSFKFSL